MEINAYTVITCKCSRDLYGQINLFLLRTVHISELTFNLNQGFGEGRSRSELSYPHKCVADLAMSGSMIHPPLSDVNNDSIMSVDERL